MRVLWIARELPFPQDSGDRIYSALLVRALSASGVHVRVLGHPAADGARASDADSVDWVPVPGGRRRTALALASPLPLFAAVHATPAYRDALRAALDEHWDAVVLDQLGSGWALATCRALRSRGGPTPAVVHVSHNDETAIWSSMVAQSGGSLPRRLAVRLNAARVARLETEVLRGADLVSAITAEDAAGFGRRAPGVRRLVLTPGYAGPVAEPRTIDHHTPRRVVLVGSYGWVVKQENLRRFLAVADPAFADRGIGLDVVGRMPDALRGELAPGLRATRLHGFVDDVGPLLRSARFAAVPELIGGGFKLKLLDYLFGRVPVATITAAAAGLDEALRDRMLCRDDLPGLVAGIIDSIDDVATLDARQREAFELARQAFSWSDRGEALRRAIEACAPR